MRLPIILILVSSSAALADPNADHVRAVNLDPALVPAVCQPLAAGLPLEAKVSIASCIATVNLQAVYMSDTTSSYAALNAAVRPTMVMLDQVIAVGEPRSSLEALATKAGLLDAMSVRLRNTAPPLAKNATPSEIQLSTQRHDAIEVAIIDWRTEAQKANQGIVDIAARHPGITQNNPVVAYDVRRASASAGIVAAR